MKEIQCPACGESIPYDSKYCDMCGVELLECINCGSLGTDSFCADCGNPMIARNIKCDDNSKKSNNKEETFAEDKTIGGSRKMPVLKARKGNFILRPANDAIIGRQKDSPYFDLLAECSLISRRHGKFIKRGRDWYIVDLGSTNGTLVNDLELTPVNPVKLSIGDVVDIGTYIFDVIER